MKEDEFAWKLFSAGIEVARANGQTHTPKAKVALKRTCMSWDTMLTYLIAEPICCIKTIADEILSQRSLATSCRYCLLDHVIL